MLYFLFSLLNGNVFNVKEHVIGPVTLAVSCDKLILLQRLQHLEVLPMDHLHPGSDLLVQMLAPYFLVFGVHILVWHLPVDCRLRWVSSLAHSPV